MEKSIHSTRYAVFLKVLREARERAGLTQVQLARKIGETQTFVSKCERGERRVDRSEEHTSELQSLRHLVCRLLLEKNQTALTHQQHIHSSVDRHGHLVLVIR